MRDPGEAEVPERRIAALGYGLALLATAVTLIVRLRLEQALNGEMPFLPFVVPITVAAAYGGLGPGLAATALSVALGIYFLLPESFASREGDPAGQLRVALLLLVGVSISVISEQRRRALARSRSAVAEQARLERELEVLLESERAARTEAERASRMKDDFLATVSHELRTPLNAILGWAQMLQAPGRTQDQIERGLRVVERNARLQTQLISDLLDISRVVSGKVHIEAGPVQIRGVIDAALDAVRDQATQKGIALREESDGSDPALVGDVARLQQVVWNLVSNAIKFTPAGGEVTVSLREREGIAEIAVRDTGVGIAPEFLPHVFERFRQADSSMTRQHGGLGLGLSIVKQLVALHGGEVRAESDGVGRGATFTVALPCPAVPPGEEAPRAEGAAQSLAALRILVVDDEADTLELIRRVLEEHGATVIPTASSEEALRAAGAEPRPDVVVSDIGMPGMDGYALLREIRAREAAGARPLPAIALTAYARAEDRERALSAGYAAHLTKPIEPQVLIAQVAGLSARA